MTQQKQGLNRPAKKQIDISAIKVRRETFQFRNKGLDQQHVRDLVAALKIGQDLDPIVLWRDPDTDEFVLVDGHHRLAAYKYLGGRTKVPALVYQCDLKDARVMALKENGKTRLPLTKDERMDAAWQLVRLDCYSKRETVTASGVSDGTVAKMRRTRDELLRHAPDAQLPAHWWDALADLRGKERREFTEEERDAMISAKAKQLDDKIGPELQHVAARQIEAACEVVAKRLGRRGLVLLIDEYSDLEDPYGHDEVFELEDDDAAF